MPTPELDLLGGLGRLARLTRFCLTLAPDDSPSTPLARRAAALQAASRGALASAGLEIAVSGPVPRGPVVLVSNHLSWFDPLALSTVMPLTAVAKDDVAAWPVVGARARGLGVVFVDRLTAHSGVRALLQARRALDAGVSVLNFPEGTTTRGDMVLPFRRGIFGLARLARVPVVPVRLEVDRSLTWTGPDPILPHLWRLCATARPVVSMRFFEPLHPSSEPLSPSSEPDAALAESARRLIQRPSSLRAPRSFHAAAALSA
jgi:1-acyl-sn-glycerol-3-phosphate acyltransferase